MIDHGVGVASQIVHERTEGFLLVLRPLGHKRHEPFRVTARTFQHAEQIDHILRRIVLDIKKKLQLGVRQRDRPVDQLAAGQQHLGAAAEVA